MPVSRSFFQRIPFIRIFSLFLVGILLNHYLHIDLHWTGIALTILLSILIFLWHNSNFAAIKVQNLLISFGIFLTGFFYPGKTIERQAADVPQKDYYLAEVCQKPAEKAKTYQTILLIRNNRITNSEKIVAYFSKEKFDSTITTGDQLVLMARLQEIKNSGNPFEIDYQTMMHRNGIRYSVYLNEGTYLKTKRKVDRLGLKAEKYRDKLISLLTTAIPQKEERSVVSALTLGYRTEIEQDTLDYFASTGAMHVLSVSGLHVALIYMIMGFLLSFLKRGKYGRIIFNTVMIIFLWAYAFITGFSPAVQRATVMFSFVIIGNGLGRQVNIYNSLTASAFLLILLNPEVIFDIGFQLSYLAVFGIVLIQPSLNQFLEPTNPILKWSWSLFTVSIAAQIITFPLGLYYFNQFPNLFWLSGFVVIPVTTLIIWLTLAFFVCSPIHGLAMILGYIIEKLTHIMLLALKAMDALPLAVTKGIVLTPVQVWVLFGCIIAAIIFVYSKQKQWCFLTLSFILIFQTTELIEKKWVFNQRVIWVYNTKNPMIHLVNGRSNYLLTPDIKQLSRSEKSAYEKLAYHLRLNKTIQISGFANSSLKYEDLISTNNQIQFINSTIQFNFGSKSGFRNQIELTVHGQKIEQNMEKTIICLGNAKPDKNTTGKVFEVKKEGAFSFDLKKPY